VLIVDTLYPGENHKMRTYPENIPRAGQIVVAYLPNHHFFIAEYTKVLTWKGYKFKFVNMTSNGFWKDDVVGWNRIPSEKETI